MENKVMIGYREPKSIIDAKAVGSKVIVKSYFEVSPLMVEDDKALQNMSPIKIEVVAYGRNTYDIEIGDKVQINPTNVSRINFKWNNKSIMNYLENSKLNKTLYKGKERVICEEYYLCEMIDILIVDTYNENNTRKILVN